MALLENDFITHEFYQGCVKTKRVCLCFTLVKHTHTRTHIGVTCVCCPQVWCGLTNTGELIAVKQIQLNIDDMERAEVEYEKIQEEVELLKTLNHKNIVG